MNRRPNARDGVVLPKFAAAAVAATVLGFALVLWSPAPLAVTVGGWLATVGVVGVVSAALLFWRVGPGLLLALPLWLGLAGVIASATGAPGRAGAWLIAAAALSVGSIGLVAVNRAIGSGLAFAGWLLYVGLLLRALPARVEWHRWWWWLPILAAIVVFVGTLRRW